MEEVVKNAAGEHGGKHFYEDTEFVKNKEKTTASTINSVGIAAAKLKKQNNIKKLKEEEERKLKEEGKKLK